MLISSAILSRTAAVGVGFLLNSSSRVASWSWVARCLLLFFCCWVSVLFLGGRLDALDVPPGEVDGVRPDLGGAPEFGVGRPPLLRVGDTEAARLGGPRGSCLTTSVAISEHAMGRLRRALYSFLSVPRVRSAGQSFEELRIRETAVVEHETGRVCRTCSKSRPFPPQSSSSVARKSARERVEPRQRRVERQVETVYKNKRRVENKYKNSCARSDVWIP